MTDKTKGTPTPAQAQAAGPTPAQGPQGAALT